MSYSGTPDFSNCDIVHNTDLFIWGYKVTLAGWMSEAFNITS